MTVGGIFLQTHQIYVSKGRDRVQDIRSALFAFSEVLEVFVTGRPDALVVVLAGRPRPGEWLRTLRAAGYEVSARRPARVALSEVERPCFQATAVGVAADSCALVPIYGAA
jgi:hypothetical protein